MWVILTELPHATVAIQGNSSNDFRSSPSYSASLAAAAPRNVIAIAAMLSCAFCLAADNSVGLVISGGD